MYKVVLVPLDGSERAEAILPHVETLAQGCGAKIVFLRVVGMPPWEGPHTRRYEEMLEQTEEEAERYLEVIAERFRGQGIETETVVSVYGVVVDEIMEIARREEADLIAMTSHGRTGLAEAFYGSVAASVLHRIDRPLLVVRPLKDES
jgi:nucleotide-binding universal stress UspA family protein